MLRTRLKVVFITVLIIVAHNHPAIGQEDPVVRGKKLTDWFKFIREDKDARRRLAALQLVESETGPKVNAVFPALAKELREHPDPLIRTRVASLCPRYKERGDEVAVALKTALSSDKSAEVRAAAAIALGQMERVGFSAIRELSDALKDAHPLIRSSAAEALGRFGRIDPEIAKDALLGLAEMLKDSDRTARLNAAFALGRMDAHAVFALPELSEALVSDKDVAVRKEIMKAMAGMGDKAKRAAPALLTALTDSSAEVRQSAAVTLGKIAPDASLVLPAIIKAAHDTDTSVRCHAIHAIGSLGKAALSAIPDLIEILRKDNATEVRLAAIVELGGFGPDAKAAAEALSLASRDGRPAIREAAQEALKKVQQTP